MPRGRDIIKRLALVLALAPVGSAAAHDRLPASVSVTLPPSGARGLMVGTTFGVLVSGGDQKWTWICDEAIGERAVYDARVVWQPSGALLVPTFHGLFESRDGGCTFTRQEDIGRRQVPNLAIDPADPRVVFAPGTDTMASKDGSAVLYRSDDDGRTFEETSLTRERMVFTSVDVARSDPRRIYVGAINYREGRVWIQRSDDGGATWEEIPQAITSTAGARVGGVSPVDEDVLFIESAESYERVVLLKSTDGGRTSRQVLEMDRRLRDLAFSPDGRTVWAASEERVYRSADGGETFQTLPSPSSNGCIAPDGQTVYACGLAEGWDVGVSRNGGESFGPLLSFPDIAGVHDCPAGTPTRDICDVYWPALVASLGMPAGSRTSTPAAMKPPAEEDPGCSCATHSESRSGHGAAAALLILALVRSLARRRPASHRLSKAGARG